MTIKAKKNFLNYQNLYFLKIQEIRCQKMYKKVSSTLFLFLLPYKDVKIIRIIGINTVKNKKIFLLSTTIFFILNFLIKK